MKWILQVIYAVICGLTIWGIYVIKRNKVLRFNEGQLIEGKIIGIKELMGRPVRYIVEVDCPINNDIQKKKIVTTDKRINQEAVNGILSLIYVEKTNKVYWAEDKSIEDKIKVCLLLAGSVAALILFIVSL